MLHISAPIRKGRQIVNNFADALALYDQAIGNGQPQEQFAAADALMDVEAQALAERVQLAALALHLRGVASLVTGNDALLATCLAAARELARSSPGPVTKSVEAIVSFCSYYSAGDVGFVEEALKLFVSRTEPTGIARLDAGASINEIRTHSLALAHGVPGHSADRVEALTRELLAGQLAPRQAGILAITLGDFYRRLAVTYGDPRFLRQGLALLEPIARDENAQVSVANAALGGIWQMLASGLEFDPNFPIPRDFIALGQCRVRQHRASGGPIGIEICDIACGLGLRARFDWERGGKRSGVLRALSYLRVAARGPSHGTIFATTLRVAYEAGLGAQYLQQSLEAFDALRASPGFRGHPHDDANFASTLMLIGNTEGDPGRLAQAMELYASAIAREPDTAVNVSRYINLALVTLSHARLVGGVDGVDDATAERLARGLDAVIWMEVLDPPGSTHATLRHQVASSYYGVFRSVAGDRAHSLILDRITTLFEGKEQRWPIGFVRYLCERIRLACEEGEADHDLLLRCAAALERAKPFLQVIDLCDGGDALTEEIDQLFATAIMILRSFVGAGRDTEGLQVIDRLTAGFVRDVTVGSDLLGDSRVAPIVQRAIAGVPLSLEEVGFIRRSALGVLVAADDEPMPAARSIELRLDLLRAGGQFLALRRDADGLAVRLFAPRAGLLASNAPELVAGLAEFAREIEDTLWVGFRNFPPEAAHDLFHALRAAIETGGSSNRVLRHAARSLAEPLVPIAWDAWGPRPRFLVAHSPQNGAPPLNFGFAFAARLRDLGAEMVELAGDACNRGSIVRHLADADALFLVSHGERGPPDRILLAGDDHADAAWLLQLETAVRGKCLFFIACNSGHFNARLTHDDIGLAPLSLALGARGVFSTLRSVDELAILLLVEAALDRWRRGAALSTAFADTRVAMLAIDDEGWAAATSAFVRDTPAAAPAHRSLDAAEPARLAADRADIDVGWSFVLG